ncbi:E3 ubiquitin-protein ligase TOM1-like [Smittium culicis]|uniref:HECT-type E3 ubiquitin transferase n=1 Tax=Smittium culicis TaxID=133412 RepID=A0A1R1YT38_9FUNG|nr:E3 ubiquitin-protein ligase TOM1-like [Smittium culicis]
MVKIKKQIRKKLNFPPHEISELRHALETVDESQLFHVVSNIKHWPFLRSDFYYWIKVLDRFDEILEKIISKHSLIRPDSHLVRNDLPDDTAQLICAILDFTRLLMENCINRTIYSSIERLGALLCVPNNLILEKLLRLLLQISQSGSFQQDIKTIIHSLHPILEVLSQPWLNQKNLENLFENKKTPNDCPAIHNELKLIFQKPYSSKQNKKLVMIDFSFYRSASDVLKIMNSKETESSDNITESIDDSSKSHTETGFDVLETPKAIRNPAVTPSRKKNLSRSSTSKKLISRPNSVNPFDPSFITEGLVSIEVPLKNFKGLNSTQILDSLANFYKVPAQMQFSLFHRIRVSLALSPNNHSDLSSLFKARIYLSHTTSICHRLALSSSKEEFKTLLSRNQDKISQNLSELLKPESNVPLDVQTAVVYALDSFLDQSSEISNIYSALNVSANHGIIMFILRKIFNKSNPSSDPNICYPRDFRNSVYNLLITLTENFKGVRLLASSGIVSVLVEALNFKDENYYYDVFKSSRILNCLLSSKISTFSSFIDENGLPTLIDRIDHEVTRLSAIEDSLSDIERSKFDSSSPLIPNYPSNFDNVFVRPELVPSSNVILLREIFKMLSRLMLSNSNQDRLRNLVEGSLPSSLTKVFKHQTSFGCNVYGYSIDIMANMIHNEPTSLSVLQEVGLPQIFLDLVSKNIPFSGDVIAAIPNGIGALCLNEAGVEMLNNSKLLDNLFGVFTNVDFLKVLTDSDVPGSLGIAMDEFMRHFPNLKPQVLDSMISSLKNLLELGKPNSAIAKVNPGFSKLFIGDSCSEKKEHLCDIYNMMVESMSAFLESLLEERSHNALFLEKGGLEILLSCIKSDLLNFNWPSSKMSRSINGIIRSISRSKPEETFNALFDLFKDLLKSPSYEFLLEKALTDLDTLINPSNLDQETQESFNQSLHLLSAVSGILFFITDSLNNFNSSVNRHNLNLHYTFCTEENRVFVEKLTLLFDLVISSEIYIVDLSESSSTTPKLCAENHNSAASADVILSLDNKFNKPYCQSNIAYLKDVLAKSSSNFTKFFQSFTKLLIPKKTTSLEISKDIFETLRVISHFSVSGLNSVPSLIKSPRKLKYIRSIVEISSMLLIKYNVRALIQVPFLAAFVLEGGIKSISNLITYLIENGSDYIDLNNSKLDNNSSNCSDTTSINDKNIETADKFNEVLEMVFTVIRFLSSGSNIIEYPYLPNVKVFPQSKTPCIFIDSDNIIIPHVLISEIMNDVFPAIQSIWESSKIVKYSPDVMESLIHVIKALIQGENEPLSKPVVSDIPSNLSRGDNHSQAHRLTESFYHEFYDTLIRPRGYNRNQSNLNAFEHEIYEEEEFSDENNAIEPRLSLPELDPIQLEGRFIRHLDPRVSRPIIPNQSHVDSLLSMGFPLSAVNNALIRTFNSLDRAADYLVSHPEEVLSSQFVDTSNPHTASNIPDTEISETVELSVENDDYSPNITSSESNSMSLDESRGHESSNNIDISDIDTDAPSIPAVIQNDTLVDYIPVEANGVACNQAQDLNTDLTVDSNTTYPNDLIEMPNSATVPSEFCENNLISSNKPKEIDIDKNKSMTDNLFKDVKELRLRLVDSIPSIVTNILLDTSKFKFQMLSIISIFYKSKSKDKSTSITKDLACLYSPLVQISERLSQSEELDEPSSKVLLTFSTFWALIMNDPSLSASFFDISIEVFDSLTKILSVVINSIMDASPGNSTDIKPNASNVTHNIPEWFTPAILCINLFIKTEDEILSPICNPSPLEKPKNEDSQKEKPENMIGKASTSDGEHVENYASSDTSNLYNTYDKPKKISKASIDRKFVYNIAFNLIKILDKSNISVSHNTTNSILRLLMYFSRDKEFNEYIIKGKYLIQILRVLKRLPDHDGIENSPQKLTEDSIEKSLMSSSVHKSILLQIKQERMLVTHIVRHVVETSSIIKGSMTSRILSWLDDSQFRSPEVLSFLRGNSGAVLRDPIIFSDITAKHCSFLTPDSTKLSWRFLSPLKLEDVAHFESMSSCLDSSHNGKNIISLDIDKADVSTEKDSSTLESVKSNCEGKEIDASLPEKPFSATESELLDHAEIPDEESIQNARSIVTLIVEEILSLRDNFHSNSSKISSFTPSIFSNANLFDTNLPKKLPQLNIYNGDLWFESSEITAYRCYLLQLFCELLMICPFAIDSVLTTRANSENASNNLQPSKNNFNNLRSPLISHLVHDLIVREASINAALLTMAETNLKHSSDISVKSDTSPSLDLNSNVETNIVNNTLEKLSTESIPSTSPKNHSIENKYKNLLMAKRLLCMSRSQLCLSQINWSKIALCLLCPSNTLNPLVVLSDSSNILQKTHKKAEQLFEQFEKENKEILGAPEGPSSSVNSRSEQPSIIKKNLITEFNQNYESSVDRCRKLVLDHLCRAFKETLSCSRLSNPNNLPLTKKNLNAITVSIEITYSRLKSLSNLLNRLLNTKPSCNVHDLNDVHHKCIFTPEPSDKIGIMLLQRGMFDILNATITSLDLNYSQSKPIFNSLLKPMSQLSEISANLSKDDQLQLISVDKSDKNFDLETNPNQSYDILSIDRVIFEAIDEDIPPDLYQNSALGLFHGDLQRPSGIYRADAADGGSSSEDGFYSDHYDEDSSMSDFSESESENSADDNEVAISRGDRYNYIPRLLNNASHNQNNSGNTNQNASSDWVDITLQMDDNDDGSNDDGEDEDEMEDDEDDDHLTAEEIHDGMVDDDGFIEELDDIIDSDVSIDSGSQMSADDDFDSDLEYNEELVLDVLENLDSEFNFESGPMYNEEDEFSHNTRRDITNHNNYLDNSFTDLPSSGAQRSEIGGSNHIDESLVSTTGNAPSSLEISSLDVPTENDLQHTDSNSEISLNSLNFGDPSAQHQSYNPDIEETIENGITNIPSNSHTNRNASIVNSSGLNPQPGNISNNSLSSEAQIIVRDISLPSSDSIRTRPSTSSRVPNTNLPAFSASIRRLNPPAVVPRMSTVDLFSSFMNRSGILGNEARDGASVSRALVSRPLFRNSRFSAYAESESEFDDADDNEIDYGDDGDVENEDIQEVVEDYHSGSDYSDSIVDFLDNPVTLQNRNNVFSISGNANTPLNNLETSLTDIINVFVSGQSSNNRRHGMSANSIYGSINDLSHPLFNRSNEPRSLCNRSFEDFLISPNNVRSLNLSSQSADRLNLNPQPSRLYPNENIVDISHNHTNSSFLDHSITPTVPMPSSAVNSIISATDPPSPNSDIAMTAQPINLNTSTLIASRNSHDNLFNNRDLSGLTQNHLDQPLSFDSNSTPTSLDTSTDNISGFSGAFNTSSSNCSDIKPLNGNDYKDHFIKLKSQLCSVIIASAATNVNPLMSFYDRWQQESRIWNDRLVNEKTLKYGHSLMSRLSDDSEKQLSYRNRISAAKNSILKTANKSSTITKNLDTKLDLDSSSVGLVEATRLNLENLDSLGDRTSSISENVDEDAEVSISCVPDSSAEIIEPLIHDTSNVISATQNESVSLLPEDIHRPNFTMEQEASQGISLETTSSHVTGIELVENASISSETQPLSGQATNNLNASSTNAELDSQISQPPNQSVAGSENIDDLTRSIPENSELTNTQNPPDPIFIQIDGRMVDVTNLGIDYEFLNAIPNDMRRDVILQRMGELELNDRTDVHPTHTSNSSDEPDLVSREFLEALPIDIRQEVIQQQQLLRRIHERQERINSSRARNHLTTDNNSDSDASPNPDLLETPTPLPPSNLADSRGISSITNIETEQADNISNTLPTQSSSISQGISRSLPTGSSVTESKEFIAYKESFLTKNAVQLLSPAELSRLVKLVFLPKGNISDKLLGQVIFNLCKNINSRGDFISVLLKVLSENCSSLKRVEETISNYCLDNASKNSITLPSTKLLNSQINDDSHYSQPIPSSSIEKPISEKSISANEKHPYQNETPFPYQPTSIVQNFPLSRLKTDVAPYFPAICCLEALIKLAQSVPGATLSFLVESSLPDTKNIFASKDNFDISSSNNKNILLSLAEDRLLINHSNPNSGVLNHVQNSENFLPCPLVILLRLLENPMFYGTNSSVTELLMQLLAAISKPLSAFVRRKLAIFTLTGKETSPLPSISGQPIVTNDTQTDSAPQNIGFDNQPSSSNTKLDLPSKATDIISDDLQKSKSTFRPPKIPEYELRLISNVLVAGECTSKTFQYTLSLIQHLLNLEGSLYVIMDSLKKSAFNLAEDLCVDLQNLITLLEKIDYASNLKRNSPNLDESKTVNAAADFSGDINMVDVEKNLSKENISELTDELQTLTINQFSSASSCQSKILRLLKAFDYIITHTSKKADPDFTPRESPYLALIKNQIKYIRKLELEIWKSDYFIKLWDLLSVCLTYSQKLSSLSHISTVLLPITEAFMVVSKPLVKPSLSKLEKTANKSSSNSSLKSFLSSSDGSVTDSFFVSFTDMHKKILNSLVRNTPGLLSGSFSLLVHNPRVLDFDNKRSYVYQKLSSIIANNSRNNTRTLNLNVRRQYVFEDSFHQFAGKSGNEIRGGKLNVKFHDEEGVDVGGVTREWFQVLSRQMFNPDYALFLPSASDRITYQPNPQSWANPDHLFYFKFVGRIIGKAICDQRLLDAYFTRSFYKHMLGKPVDYKDLEALDPEYSKSLQWILDNDITDVVDETFSVELDDFGQRRVIELLPNGSQIQVTEENKAEYVKLVAEQRLSLAIKDQIKSFLDGFHELVPKDLIQIMNEQEIELLISGMPDIDVDDWRNNTEYQGGYSPASPQIIWFWRTVRSFDQEERAKLLQFVTGTSKVPLEGFSKLQGSGGIQKFQIHRDFSSAARLPSAHTCFNQLDLPLYDSYETLRSQLLLAISECTTGFGFS